MQIDILCIETSGKRCSVALSRDGVCIATKTSEEEWSQSEQITLLIQELLRSVYIQGQALNAVALSQGPGSYTGLRVGASAAKAICYVHEIPLIAIDTLKVLAFPHVKTVGEDQFLIPMIDARRAEVYYNIYNAKLHSEQETVNLILEADQFSDLNSPIICGDGAEKAGSLIKHDTAQFRPDHAKAEHMSQLAFDSYIEEKFENLAYFNPFYLKPPNITKSKKLLL